MHSARSTTIWVLLSLGAAFAVVAWSAARPLQAPRAPLASRSGVAPPVRTVDQAPPAAIRPLLALEFGVSPAGAVSGLDVACAPKPCTAADIAQANAREATRQKEIRPAAGTAARAVAELPGTAVLLAWRNEAAKLCLFVTRPAGSGSGPFGPCLHDDPNVPCSALCLTSDPTGSAGAPPDYLLAGTVRSDATALRITTGRTRMTYQLRGPILRGTGRRVFMLDLGRNDFRVLELLQGTSVIDSRELPAMQAAYEDCRAAHPAMTDFKSCIQGAATIVPSTSLP